MARKGRAGPALAIAAIGSFVAGCFGTVLIALFGPPLTSLALEFRSPDYFSLVLMALILTATLISGPILWGLGMAFTGVLLGLAGRSEEHTSELQSLMRISYAVFCLKKKNNSMNLSSTSIIHHGSYS